MSTKLTRYETSEGIELVINCETGESFATLKGYMRMSGKAKSTISERVKGVRLEYIKDAEIHTPGGLQGVRLIPAKIVFKWLLKDNPELAEAMGTAGATIYLQRLAGYKQQLVEAEPPQHQYKEAIDLAGSYLVEAGIDSKLVAGVKLNQAERYGLLPREIVAESHKVLAASFESPLLYTPTKLGQELGTSAVKINKLLTAAGYQVKNKMTSKTDPAYSATEKGKEFSANTLATGDRNDNSTYQHLKWKSEILNVLKTLLTV